MRRLSGSISQITVMAAIVTTLMYGPVGALLALLCFAVLGVSFRSFVTFGDTFNALPGLLVWWAICFLLAFAYAAFMFPGRSSQASD
jgi:hypothetical protein